METRNNWLSQTKRGMSSRRAHVRFPLRISVGFHWKEDGGVKKDARGWTRNISEQGAFIETAECPVERDSVNLQFRIPSPRKPWSVRATRMVMEARVVRVESDATTGSRVGFAVQKRTAMRAKDETPPGRAFSGICGSMFRPN